MTGKKILPFVVEEPCVELDYEDSIEKVEAYLADWSEDVPLSDPETDRHPS